MTAAKPVAAAPPSAFALQRVVSLAQATLETLRTEHGQVIEDDSEILASLVEEGIDLAGILLRLVRCAEDAEADAAAAQQRMADLAARKARYERQQLVCRATLAQCLGALGLRRWQCPEATVSVRPGVPRVVITNADALAPEYRRTTTMTSPDTAAIRRALEAGTTVTGALLGDPDPVLTIRSR